MKKYRIHPGIGMARIGNSTADGNDGFFIGPETADIDFRPDGDTYRDAAHAIRRQAARFRIYEYTFDDIMDPRPTNIREVTADEADITWHVDLANQKAFTRTDSSDRLFVPIAPGETSVSGKGQSVDVSGELDHDEFEHKVVQLGTLKTDDAGRLLVLGGFGRAESPRDRPLGGLFNHGWFDDVSDGPVRADIRLHDTGQQASAESAWVVVGLPAFAAPIINIVTMYDVAFDIAVRHFSLPAPTTVSFTRDIYPVLRRTVEMHWVSASAGSGHGPGEGGDFLAPVLFDLLRDNNPTPGSAARAAREHVFSRLKPLAGGSFFSMPFLQGPASPQTPGAVGLTLTHTQHDQFEKWSRGEFSADWSPPVHVPFETLTPAAQTEALDKAGLFTGVGGTYGPGIEVGRSFGETSSYDRPFRVSASALPGFLTATLAIPWQSDYLACGSNWWPGGRPNRAKVDGAEFRHWIPETWGMRDLVEQWHDLGFMKRVTVDGDLAILETERQV